MSSSWCSTFPGSSTFPGVQRCREGVPGVAWEGRALARPLHRAGARRSREFYVFGKLGVLGSGESGVAWEGRALARPLHRAGARRSQETRRSREFNVTGRVFRGLPGRDEHWLVHFIELVLDVPRKRDQEARRSPVVAFQSNNPKVMRLQIERLGCCSSRWGARMSLGRALRAFWYCCSISRSICVSRFIDGGVSALSSRPVVMDLNQPASFCAGSTW